MKFRKSELDRIIGENVARILEKRGLSKEPFARSFEMNEGQFRSLLKGRTRWNTSHIELVAEQLGLEPVDIMFPELRKPPRIPVLEIQETPRFKAFADVHPLSKQMYIPIRLLKDAVAAGLPSQVNETDLEGWVLIYASKEWMPHDAENYTCAHVIGYSMWPILAPGDIVAIDHADKIPADLENKMVAFRDNGGVTIKWLRHVPDQEMIIGEPENPDEKKTALYIKGNEVQDRIVGRVAWWWSKR